ncbi:MAG: hypothetical protein ABFD70_00310 [Syntrophaceae bacterium]|nr:hypothetical protein [Deltaproteobacteria bacterium]
MIYGLLSASVRTVKIPQLESWVFYVVMEMISSIDGDFLPWAAVVPNA